VPIAPPVNLSTVTSRSFISNSSWGVRAYYNK